MLDLPEDNRKRLNELERTVVRLETKFEADISQMKAMMTEVRKDTRETRDVVLGAKGGWKTALAIAGVSAAIGGVIVKLASMFQLPS